MSMKGDIKLSYNGGPYDVLPELIRLRGKWLGEKTKDSAVACAIDICRSLRADTRVASYKHAKTKGKDTGYFAYFSARDRRWKVTRDWRKRGAAAVDMRLKYVALEGVKSKSAHVYEIETEQGEKYYAAAANLRKALQLEKDAAKKRLARYKGLAKNTLLVAMGKMANVKDRPANKMGADVKKKSSSLAQTRITEQKNNISVWFTSGIDYGKLALKHSPDLAAKKAANKIAGMLRRAAKSAPFLTKEPKTPFPEVLSRKKK